MNKFGLSDSVLAAANAVLNKQEVEDLPEAMEMHLKPHGTDGTQYKVHAVGKKLAAHGGIKVGEVLSDTEVDDAQESGIRVKHIKEGVGSAVGSVVGGAARTAGKVVGGTARIAGKVAGSVAGGTAAAAKGTIKGVAQGAGAVVKGTAQGAKQAVKRTVAGIREDQEIDEMEDDEGWYTHNAMHGDKGVSRQDWKKGIRLNSKGERVNINKKKQETSEGAFSRMDVQRQEKERLGADKVKGDGLRTFVKMPPQPKKEAKPVKEEFDIDGLLEMTDEQFDQYLNESTDQQLDELLGALGRGVGKVVGGAARLAGRGAMGAGKLAAKGVGAAANRLSVQGRADAAERKTQNIQAKTKAVQDKMAARKKLATQKAAASLAKQKLAAVKQQAKKQRSDLKKPAYATEEVEEIEESVGLSTSVMSFLDDYENIMERKLSSKEKMKRGLYNEKKQLDPVGQEDGDIDNDGDKDKSDRYLHNRRKAIAKAMKEAKNEDPPFDGGKPIEKKRMDKFGNVIKQKNMARHLARMAMQKQKDVTKEDYDPLLEGAGDEQPNSAGNAASLAKHYREKGKQAAAAGNTEVAAKMMAIAKKFYNKADHMAGREKAGQGSVAETYWSDEEIEFFEGTDNPANVQHMCMKQVAHEEYGQGECIHGEHADPVDGEVAWYSVQFEHGIEIVDSNDLEVISEMHHGHAKKKMKEDYTPEQQEAIEQIEEARKGGGAAVGETERSGIRVTKSSKEEPEHIAMQLRKVISVGANHEGVHFDSGKAKVHQNVAQAALNRYNRAKPAEKEELQKHMKHSPKALAHVAGGHDLSKSPAAEKKSSGIDSKQFSRYGVASKSGHYN